jgi:SAM-dependent methyltransferase
MTKIPDDPAARQAWLERWATQQEERTRLALSESRSPRLRARINTMIERQVERLDPVIDRGLNTSESTPISATEAVISGPSPWHILPRSLRKVNASGNDVFVDFGCGTGRVVHQAARRPLKRVIGVEVNPPVADRAKSLVAAHQPEYRCKNVEVVTCDVMRFRVPDDLTIAYLGQVQGFSREVLDTLLRNLTESIDRCPRCARLIYYQPTYGGGQPATPVVQATGRFRLLPDISFGATAIFESYGSPPSAPGSLQATGSG